MANQLPIPAFFNPQTVGEIWRVPYLDRAAAAETWAKEHGIQPATTDRCRVCLLVVDVQNTFCIPEFELFVGGQSGLGAVEDNRRLCEFIYRNLGTITTITPTMDTHKAVQIFHPVFWVNGAANIPNPRAISALRRLNRVFGASIRRSPLVRSATTKTYNNMPVTTPPNSAKQGNIP